MKFRPRKHAVWIIDRRFISEHCEVRRNRHMMTVFVIFYVALGLRSVSAVLYINDERLLAAIVYFMSLLTTISLFFFDGAVVGAIVLVCDVGAIAWIAFRESVVETDPSERSDEAPESLDTAAPVSMTHYPLYIAAEGGVRFI